MDARFIDIFRSATKTSIEAMAQVETIPQKLEKKTHNKMFGQVTGVIGMAGEGVNGTFALSFRTETILYIFEQMLGEKESELSESILDAVGEFTNVICGDVKRRLAEIDVKVGMATPYVIAGDNIQFRDRATRETVVLPFQTPGGLFVAETNLTLLAR